jgi:hypothetical protein
MNYYEKFVEYSNNIYGNQSVTNKLKELKDEISDSNHEVSKLIDADFFCRESDHEKAKLIYEELYYCFLNSFQ